MTPLRCRLRRIRNFTRSIRSASATQFAIGWKKTHCMRRAVWKTGTKSACTLPSAVIRASTCRWKTGLRFEDYALVSGACVPQRVEFTPDCFVTGRKTPFALQNGKLPLCHALFDQDAIVLKGTTGTVTLASERGSRGVR